MKTATLFKNNWDTEILYRPYLISVWFQHRKFSYSRHAVNDRDLSTQVNYRMHYNMRRLVADKKHHHKRHSKKLNKVSIVLDVYKKPSNIVADIIQFLFLSMRTSRLCRASYNCKKLLGQELSIGQPEEGHLRKRQKHCGNGRIILMQSRYSRIIANYWKQCKQIS